MKKTLAKVLKIIEERDEARMQVKKLECDLAYVREELAALCKEKGVNLTQWRFSRNVHKPNALLARLSGIYKPDEEEVFTYDSEGED